MFRYFSLLALHTTIYPSLSSSGLLLYIDVKLTARKFFLLKKKRKEKKQTPSCIYKHTIFCFKFALPLREKLEVNLRHCQLFAHVFTGTFNFLCLATAIWDASHIHRRGILLTNFWFKWRAMLTIKCRIVHASVPYLIIINVSRSRVLKLWVLVCIRMALLCLSRWKCQHWRM